MSTSLLTANDLDAPVEPASDHGLLAMRDAVAGAVSDVVSSAASAFSNASGAAGPDAAAAAGTLEAWSGGEAGAAFAASMEFAMFGVVLVGVMLCAAGVLGIAVPPTAARLDAALALEIMSGLMGAAAVVSVARATYGLFRRG